MAHWICRAIASEREFIVFVMVLVAAATFLAIHAITAWMSLFGPSSPSGARSVEARKEIRKRSC
jgi:hypothetical protein